MTGFMAGFGPAFAQSFNSATEQSNQRQEDTFKLMYSDYINRRNDIDKWQREDAKAVNKAKAYQDAYQQPDGSWPLIKNWIDSGLDDSIIAKKLSEGKLNVATSGTSSPQTTEQINQPQSTTPANPDTSNSTDTQMANSGLVKPGQNTIAKAPTVNTPPDQNTINLPSTAPIPTPSPTDTPVQASSIPAPTQTVQASTPTIPSAPTLPTRSPTQHKGLLSNLFPGFKNSGQTVDQRNANRAMDRIASVSGVNPDQVRKILAPGGMPRSITPAPSNITYTPSGDNYSIDGMSQKELMQYNTVPELGMLVEQAKASGKPALAAYAQHKLDLTRSYELQKQDALHGPTTQWFALVKTTPEGNEFVKNIPGEMHRDAQGNAYFTDSQGNPLDNGDITAIPLSDQQRQDQMALTKGPTAQAVRTYQTNTNRLANTIRLVGDMNRIVDQDPNVLNFGGKLAEVGVSGVRDIVGSIDTIASILKQNGVVSDKDIVSKTGLTLDQLESKVDQLMGTSATNRAAMAALFEAKKQLAAFQFASTQGQTGRTLSDKDYQRFLKMLDSSTDPKAWKKSVADFLGEEARSLNENAQEINNSPESQGFTKAYGYSFMPPVASTFDDYVNKSNDQNLKNGYEFIKQYSGQASMPNYQGNVNIQHSTNNQMQQDNPEGLPSFSSPNDPNFQKLPSGTRFWNSVTKQYNWKK